MPTDHEARARRIAERHMREESDREDLVSEIATALAETADAAWDAAVEALEGLVTEAEAEVKPCNTEDSTLTDQMEAMARLGKVIGLKDAVTAVRALRKARP